MDEKRSFNRALIGESVQMKHLRNIVEKVAAHKNARVLITGAPGTGKELVAQAIHARSLRRDCPFRAFNCSSCAKDLLESRLFGHERGSFTGAVRRHKGLFEQAFGGSLFLDEIAEMGLNMQAVLLRVLEDGFFMRVGGNEEIKADVRLITATNRNLPKLVRTGKFREDLYDRLNVIHIRTPSLKEHLDDIGEIANAWVSRHHPGKIYSEKQISDLKRYNYPGNVRELFNILERSEVLEVDDFEMLISEHKKANAELFAEADESEGSGLPDELEAAIRCHVRSVFRKVGGNMCRAASALKVARNTVRKYLNDADLTRAVGNI